MRGLRQIFNPIGRMLLSIPVVLLIFRTVREMGLDDATHMAAGVAYYAILSLFPLTIGLLFVFSLVLESHVVEGELVEFFQTYLPGSNEILAHNIQAVEGIRGVLGVIGVIGLFWTASAMFGAISRAVNRAWDIHEDRPFYIDKVRNILMSCGVGMLFLASMAATTSIQILGRIDLPGVGQLEFLEHGGINLLTRPLPFVFTLAIFLMVYKYVPNTETRWRYIWPGALVAAIAFEVGKSLFVFYLENFADYAKVYGSLGSVVAFLAWTYISALILIAGAELSSEYGRMSQGVGQGRLVERRPRRGQARRVD
jgi:membrane protein